MRRVFLIKLLCAALIVNCLIMPDLSQANIPEPSFNPKLTIQKINNDIRIDGDLNSDEWQSAALVSNFIERDPGDNIAPLVNTETYITYDESNLYIAFKCYDDPAAVRASMTQRDQFHGDDEVGVYIDTYGDASVAYMFFVNPFGIQKDMLWNSITGGDDGFDMIWKSSAKITKDGYEVEMAIPFSSLRFPNKDIQSWKIDFRRNHPRESYHQYSWAAVDRNESCGPCQWGTMSGISSVIPGKGIEILPAVVGSQNSQHNGTELESFDPDGEMGISGKYAISSDVTLEGSINPDFSQIEADAAQIDVNSTFSLFFPERRPFFQEGADIFRTMFNSFNTRTIANPKFVAKVTGRPGRFRFGLVSALDDSSAYIIPLEETDMTFKASKSYVNVLRGLKSIGRNSRVGFMINDRRYDEDGSNTALSIDYDFALTSKLRADAQFIYTYTKEETNDKIGTEPLYYDGDYTLNFDGESYGGLALISRIRYMTRNLFMQIGYNQIDPRYRTQTGFDPVNNHRSSDSYMQYTFFPEKGIFERITPQFSTFNRWHFGTGQKKLESINLGLHANLRVAQTGVHINYGINSEIFHGVEYNDIKDYSLDFNSQPSNIFGYYASINYGDGIARGVNQLSNRISVNAGSNIKPLDKLLVEPNIRFVRGTDKEDADREWFKQTIVRTRVSLQLNPKISIRLVGQYVNSNNTYDIGDIDYAIMKEKSFDIDPLVTYRLNPFTVFYLGMVNNYNKGVYTENLRPYDYITYDLRENQRKFFFKLQYLFQT